MRTNILIIPVVLMTMIGCSTGKQQADLILTNATVYTVDEAFSMAEAIVVRDHKIVEVGSSKKIKRRYQSSHIEDLEGAFVYPGWIDAHCHFFGYGMNLNTADLMGTTSVGEIIGRLKKHHETYGGSWITGRGWDQNDWEVKEFPNRSMLDTHFPDTPILLRRIDGHAAWLNTVAMEMAGITHETEVDGGVVMMKDGTPSGILVDNAIGLVGRLIPSPSREEVVSAIQHAEKNCFSVGLTSVHDAGLGLQTVQLIDSLYQAGSLQIRMNTWLSPTKENFEHFVKKGPYQTDHITVNTVKLFADGALGSRGALMIEPYNDDPGNKGLLVYPLELLKQHCQDAYEHNFMVATHAIGDAANREMLKIYAGILKGPNDRRWRIEHSQIIHPDDFDLFGQYNIIPSVQPTHATSDMYWAEQRVGPQRMEGAYAFRKLLDQNGWYPGGSDFPVEEINPLYGFYAATVRKDHSGYPEGGFQMDQAITREEALRAMTIWAAKSGFEEHLKGSLEPGKLADFVVTGTDLMTAPDEELFKIKVLATYSGGEVVYKRAD